MSDDDPLASHERYGVWTTLDRIRTTHRATVHINHQHVLVIGVVVYVPADVCCKGAHTTDVRATRNR